MKLQTNAAFIRKVVDLLATKLAESGEPMLRVDNLQLSTDRIGAFRVALARVLEARNKNALALDTDTIDVAVVTWPDSERVALDISSGKGVDAILEDMFSDVLTASQIEEREAAGNLLDRSIYVQDITIEEAADITEAIVNTYYPLNASDIDTLERTFIVHFRTGPLLEANDAVISRVLGDIWGEVKLDYAAWNECTLDAYTLVYNQTSVDVGNITIEKIGVSNERTSTTGEEVRCLMAPD